TSMETLFSFFIKKSFFCSFPSNKTWHRVKKLRLLLETFPSPPHYETQKLRPMIWIDFLQLSTG
ncbi:MAG: hypothetical protein QXY91_05210, partial [Thermoproteota archaeon]